MTATSNSSKSAKEMFHSAGIDHALQANDYRERILKDGATPENFKQHRWYPNYKFHSDESVRNLHKYHAIKIKEDESEDFEDIDFNDSMEDLVYDKLSDRSQDIAEDRIRNDDEEDKKRTAHAEKAAELEAKIMQDVHGDPREVNTHKLYPEYKRHVDAYRAIDRRGPHPKGSVTVVREFADDMEDRLYDILLDRSQDIGADLLTERNTGNNND